MMSKRQVRHISGLLLCSRIDPSCAIAYKWGGGGEKEKRPRTTILVLSTGNGEIATMSEISGFLFSLFKPPVFIVPNTRSEIKPSRKTGWKDLWVRFIMLP